MMDDKLQEVLSLLVGRMVTEIPDLVAIMDRAKNGEIDSTEAVRLMIDYLSAHPEANETLQLMARDAMEPLAESPHVAVPAIISQGLPETPGLIFKSPDSGLPKLNPLMEAALIERLQFDGDIPELRTGPVPLGVTPAVPVKTKALSPVALGKMLKDAAQIVRKRLDKHHAQRAKLVEAVANGNPTALAIVAKHGELVALEGSDGQPDLAVLARGSKQTDLACYRRGEVPAPMKMKTPSGSTLALMTKEERQEAAYKFFSTTQGRNSAIPTLRSMVAEVLRQRGFKVHERDPDKNDKREAVLRAAWKVSIGGAGAVQPAFSVVSVAARAIAAGLVREFEAHQDHTKDVILEVAQVGQLADRVVGWEARLLPGGEPCRMMPVR